MKKFHNSVIVARRYEKCKNWIFDHNRRIALVCGFFVFTLILVAVFWMIFEDPHDQVNDYVKITTTAVTTVENEQSIYSYQNILRAENLDFEGYMLPDPCVERRCQILCKDYLFTNVSETINAFIPNSCDSIVLTLFNIRFPTPWINQSWIVGLNADIDILELMEIKVYTILANSFTGREFTKMHRLDLIDVDILTFMNAESFNSLTALEVLKITYHHFNAQLKFEPKVFHGLEKLHTLKISGCIKDPIDLHEMFCGDSKTDCFYPNLKNIELQNNQIPFVTNRSFAFAPGAQSINLSHNKILKIEFQAFAVNKKLDLLRINDNQLSSIMDSMFDNIPPNGMVYAENNPWQCDCNLQWFKDFYLYKNRMNRSVSLLCHNSPTFEPFEEFSFCWDVPTPIPNQRFRNSIRCMRPPMVGSGSLKVISTIVNLNLTFDEFVLLQLNELSFDGETASVEVEIIGAGDPCDYLLILFTSTYIVGESALCFSPKNSTVIEGLKRGVQYTMCLMNATLMKNNPGVLEVSPFDCIGFVAPLPWSDQSWITNGDKLIVIATTIGLVIIIIIITTVSTFFFIRRHPKLLKGNRRVIVVESKSADVLIMPPEYGETPSFISYDGHGYLQTSKEANTYAEVSCNHSSRSISFDQQHGRRETADDIYARLDARSSKCISIVSRKSTDPMVYPLPPPPPPQRPSPKSDDVPTYDELYCCPLYTNM